MKSSKMVLMHLSAEQQWRHRYREQTCGYGQGKTMGWKEGVAWKHIYYLCNLAIRYMTQWTQTGALWQPRGMG